MTRVGSQRHSPPPTKNEQYNSTGVVSKTLTKQAGLAQSLRDWTVRGSNTSAGEIFHTRPDRTWGPPRLLCNGYRVSSPVGKAPGKRRSSPTPPPYSAEVKVKVKLYLYYPSRLSWPVKR